MTRFYNSVLNLNGLFSPHFNFFIFQPSISTTLLSHFINRLIHTYTNKPTVTFYQSSYSHPDQIIYVGHVSQQRFDLRRVV